MTRKHPQFPGARAIPMDQGPLQGVPPHARLYGGKPGKPMLVKLSKHQGSKKPPKPRRKR